MSLAPISGRRRLATVLTAAGLATLVAAGTVLAGTPVTNGYRDHAYGGGAFRPNGDKPQSKVWYTDEDGGAVQWWAGMFLFTSSPPRVGEPDLEAERRQDHVDPARRPSSTRATTRTPTTCGMRPRTTLYVMSVAMPNNSRPVRRAHHGGRRPVLQVHVQRDHRRLHAGPGERADRRHGLDGRSRVPRWRVDRDHRQGLERSPVGRVAAGHRRSATATRTTDGATWTPAAQLPSQVGNSIKSEMGASAVSRSDSAAVITFGSPTKDTIGVIWSDQDDLPAATDNGYYFATIAAGADPTVEGNWTRSSCPSCPTWSTTKPTTTST